MRASEKRASSEANAAEREIFETRIVDASRELVWELGTKTKISIPEISQGIRTKG